jgi:hypothetical protein
MDTFYSTHAIEQIRSALVPIFASMAPLDAAYTLALTNVLEQSIKFRLPDAGDLLGIDRHKRTFTKDELDILHMPYPATALEYTFAPDKQDISREHRFMSSRRITLVLDIPAGPGNAPLHQAIVDKLPGFNDQGGIVIMGYWSNTEDGQPPTPGDFRCDWEISACALFIPRNQDPDKFTTVGAGIYPVRRGDLLMYYALTIPLIYNSNVKRIGKESAIRTMATDLADDLHVAFDFMLALSCNNVAVAPSDGESRAKLNKKRLGNKKPPFFEYKQLMIAGAKLDANLPVDSAERRRAEGAERASPRLHLRRGHVRRLASGARKWINFMVVGAAAQGELTKDYRVTAVHPNGRQPGT